MSTIDVLHNAFTRLCGRAKVEERGRAYFFGCFAKTCRDVLVDHWHKKKSRDEITLVTEVMDGTFYGVCICLLVLTFGALLTRDGIALAADRRIQLRSAG